MYNTYCDTITKADSNDLIFNPNSNVEFSNNMNYNHNDNRYLDPCNNTNSNTSSLE